MDRISGGWLSGFLGVVIFSGSLPATRLAVTGFDPLFLTLARASIAGLVAAVLLFSFRQPRPQTRDIGPLLIIAMGVVVGFPLLTAIALKFITSAHSIVFIGLLPLATAIFAVARGGERPQKSFWFFSCMGSALVASFALNLSGEASLTGDLLMLAAIIVCGLAYAEGATLSRRLGGWQVICWALVLCLPLMLPLALITSPATWVDIPRPAWGGLVYVSLFSMLIGFVFWYKGLALGGIATVGQLQLLQPFMGLLLASTLVGEPVSRSMLVVTLDVVICVAGAKRTGKKA